MGKLVILSKEEAAKNMSRFGAIQPSDKFRTMDELHAFVESFAGDFFIVGKLDTSTKGNMIDRVIPLSSLDEVNIEKDSVYLGGFETMSDLQRWMMMEINTTFFLKSGADAKKVNDIFAEIVAPEYGFVTCNSEYAKYVITDDDLALVFKLKVSEDIIQHDPNIKLPFKSEA
jgi:hypothetical protein